jgi:hypothetical protein
VAKGSAPIPASPPQTACERARLFLARFPGVPRAPARLLRIGRIGIANLSPINRIEHRITVTVEIGAHLQAADGPPLPTLVRPLAVQTPEILGAWGIDDDAITI